MATTNALNTRTTNLLELLGNGHIYRVPPFQREYSWDEEQWEDLWDDILELRGHPDDRHYMGALVVEATSDREFLIIDGQQRLATLMLLALAVISQLRGMAKAGIDAEANQDRAAQLRARFIGEKDPASLIESTKLFLNETDGAFFQDYLVQLRPPLHPRGLPHSSQLLWKCFGYFQRCLDGIPEFHHDGAAPATLLSETVARQLMFILITVDDDLNAYTVFETLNARYVGLTTTDLLKNFLFSRVQVAADLDALQRRWKALVSTVRQESFPEFLRYHFLCEQPRIRSERLYKLARERAGTPQQVFSLLEALERRSDLFAALSDANEGFWAEAPDARPYLRELTLFRVRQMTPLLFAAWERLSRDDFTRVLRLVSVVSFRYTVVGGRNSNELEPVYHVAAKAVLDGVAVTPQQVFERLKPIYVDDARFEQDFRRLSVDTAGQRKRLAKYILSRLESDLSGRECNPDTDPASIEHILPENPLDEWEAVFPRQSWDEAAYRLGNLTLLEPGLNRDIGNSPYLTKVQAYERSRYLTTQQIPENAPEQWTPELLDERQRQMAARARHLWRSDFA